MSLTPTQDDSRATHYDAVREQHYVKPKMRGWSHLVWFGLCLALGPWAVVTGSDGARSLVALTIYVAALAGLFGTSACYHCGTWSTIGRQRWQRLDQVMILFMIAGTSTPAFLLAFPGALGLSATISIWALAIAVAVVHAFRLRVPERLTGGAFLLLGWIGVLALPAIWTKFGVSPALLILGGGLLYTFGAIVYHRRAPDPAPAIFGYHEVFHVFVCVAATSQFVAITVYLT